MITGTCLCGAVRYGIDGPFSFMGHCHCSMCRKAHGALYATWIAAPRSGFRWIAGEDAIDRFESSPGGQRAFCRHCGSVAPILMDDSVGMPAGNLDGDPGIRPQLHMFVGSKAAWHPITDDLPQYPEWPPGFDTPGVPRPAPEPRAGAPASSCLCGGMAWEVEGPPLMMYHCHCSRCRRARSAAHATNAFYKLDRFRWLRGEELLRSFKLPDAQFFSQDFCSRCGSPAPRVMAAYNRVMLPAGAMDGDPGAPANAHIFASSRAPWDAITDDLPQFDAMPPRG